VRRCTPYIVGEHHIRSWAAVTATWAWGLLSANQKPRIPAPTHWHTAIDVLRYHRGAVVAI